MFQSLYIVTLTDPKRDGKRKAMVSKYVVMAESATDARAKLAVDCPSAFMYDPAVEIETADSECVFKSSRLK